jgi:GTP-binding protein HflX
VIITDTVGFIQDLPKDLMTAFGATLEELESADLLLHVVDIANPRCMDQVEAVDRILGDLSLDRIPSLRVLNKMDLVDPETAAGFVRQLGGIAVSANDAATLSPLIEKMARSIDRIEARGFPVDG